MEDYSLAVVERRFAELIWAHAPIASGELVKLCEQELKWKKSTTYTVLRRLSQRGLFENDKGIVRALVSKEDFYALQSRQFVQQTFGGSLPQFLTAFTTRQKLSEAEIAALQRLIADSRET